MEGTLQGHVRVVPSDLSTWERPVVPRGAPSPPSSVREAVLVVRSTAVARVAHVMFFDVGWQAIRRALRREKERHRNFLQQEPAPGHLLSQNPLRRFQTLSVQHQHRPRHFP